MSYLDENNGERDDCCGAVNGHHADDCEALSQFALTEAAERAIALEAAVLRWKRAKRAFDASAGAKTSEALDAAEELLEAEAALRAMVGD